MLLLIKKVINNNVLLVVDSRLQEFVVMGKGIGFGCNVNDVITSENIDKKFLLSKGDKSEFFVDFINEMDPKIIELVEEMSIMINNKLDIDYSGFEFYGLLDHISNCINRANLSIKFSTTVDNDLLSIYTLENSVASDCALMIKDKLGIILNENEIKMIAVHLINSKHEIIFSSLSKTTTRIINEIIDIIRYYFQYELDDSKYYYTRFITHLKFFVLRHQQNKVVNSLNQEIFEVTRQKHRDIYECCLLIKGFLESTYQWEITDDEILYLMIHISQTRN